MSAEEFHLFSEPRISGLQFVVRVIDILAATESGPLPTKINRLATLNP